MKKTNSQARTSFRRRLLGALRVGSGSMVVATAVTVAPPADAAVPAADTAVLERADNVRARFAGQQPPTAESQPQQFAWWGNWHNGGWGWHPWWHNWPNWHNWHNWGNW